MPLLPHRAQGDAGALLHRTTGQFAVHERMTEDVPRFQCVGETRAASVVSVWTGPRAVAGVGAATLPKMSSAVRPKRMAIRVDSSVC